jgi:hypothetical protein
MVIEKPKPLEYYEVMRNQIIIKKESPK